MPTDQFTERSTEYQDRRVRAIVDTLDQLGNITMPRTELASRLLAALDAVPYASAEVQQAHDDMLRASGDLVDEDRPSALKDQTDGAAVHCSDDPPPYKPNMDDEGTYPSESS